MKKNKKIAYISGTRADFGLMTPILHAINQSNKLSLSLYATGMHLMPKFGNTFKEARGEFPGVKKINATFDSDDRLGIAKFIGKFSIRLVETLNEDLPDLVLTLGDRPEMLCVSKTCLYLGIPTGHVHGGERTYTVDEVARHAITKLSHVHFPATEESAQRIKKMGEEDWRIHVVGAPALDVILNEKLPTRKELFKELNIDQNQKVILVSQHPVSEEIKQAGKQMEETLAAVKKFNLPVIVIYPHADAGGRKIIQIINRERNNPLFHIFPSLPYKQFLALEREAMVWIGNSSGAMIESSSFKTPVVNIGMRQLGRQRGENVIDVAHNQGEIETAINKSMNDKKYLAKLTKITNPWGDGKTGQRVAKILENITIDDRLLTKRIAY
ncbi:MAG: UDP-N-acetylglucosamine 2-epimerase [bacterium]|nr:UDP-N-acetylglucosamine 2-epimerase [bacterium]